MTACSAGSADASQSPPRLIGRMMPGHDGVAVAAGPLVALEAPDREVEKSGWRSGAGRPGSPAPEEVRLSCGAPAGSGIVRAAREMNVASTWSCRLRPTPGRSATTSIPSAPSSSAGPRPESSSFGRLEAPPHTIDLALGADVGDGALGEKLYTDAAPALDQQAPRMSSGQHRSARRSR